ncbi:MAG: hypothetical protein DI619_00825 [Francisella sp.]|nr:MAG: hypothetical protein DI619_00825 [Francisella sp.]
MKKLLLLSLCSFILPYTYAGTKQSLADFSKMLKIQQVRITKGDSFAMRHFSQSDDHINSKRDECMNACMMHNVVKYSFPNIFQKGTIH